MSKIKKKFHKGFSLIEILVVIGLFAIVAVSVSIFALDSFKFSQGTGQRVGGSTKLQEITNAVILYKSDNWNDIIDNTDGGDLSLALVNNKYQLVDGQTSEDGYTYYFTIEPVERDSNGNIVESGGTIDPQSRAVNITMEWDDVYGSTQQLNSTIYVNTWNQERITQTTADEFDAGSHTETFTTETGDGEVSLQKTFYADWCNPGLASNEYDIPGSATSTSVFANFDTPTNTGRAYFGTKGSASGDSLTKSTISGGESPTITIDGTWDGEAVNDIFVVGNYAYLATNNDNKEIIILNITSTPYTETGYVNVPNWTHDAKGVFVKGTVGYMASDQYMISFNLTGNNGSRGVIAKLKLSTWWLPGTVSQVEVNGNYLFASMNNDWYELIIVDISNMIAPSIKSRTSTNNQQAFDLDIRSDGNRAYFGTGASSSEAEFFIVNTTTKTQDNLPTIGTFDTNGMSIKALSVVEQHNRVILIGTNGEEYQALDISNESSPTKCGGKDFNSGLTDISTVSDNDGNVFSYIMGSDPIKEFQIIQGGPGGGDENGYAYLNSGTFLSEVLDTGFDNANYFSIDWIEQTPFDTDLKIQMRSGTTSNLTNEGWVGPDGTSNTYFTNQLGESLPENMDGKRYVQYQVTMTTNDISATPLLEAINIYMENGAPPEPEGGDDGEV